MPYFIAQCYETIKIWINVFKTIIRISELSFVFRKSKKDRQCNGQVKKDKQWSTKHYTENLIIEQHEPHKIRKDKQSMLH